MKNIKSGAGWLGLSDCSENEKIPQCIGQRRTSAENISPTKNQQADVNGVVIIHAPKLLAYTIMPNLEKMGIYSPEGIYCLILTYSQAIVEDSGGLRKKAYRLLGHNGRLRSNHHRAVPNASNLQKSDILHWPYRRSYLATSLLLAVDAGWEECVSNTFELLNSVLTTSSRYLAAVRNTVMHALESVSILKHLIVLESKSLNLDNPAFRSGCSGIYCTLFHLSRLVPPDESTLHRYDARGSGASTTHRQRTDIAESCKRLSRRMKMLFWIFVAGSGFGFGI